MSPVPLAAVPLSVSLRHCIYDFAPLITVQPHTVCLVLKVVFIDQWYHGEMLASLQAFLWPFKCSVGPVTEESRASEPKMRKFNFEPPIDHSPS